MISRKFWRYICIRDNLEKKKRKQKRVEPTEIEFAHFLCDEFSERSIESFEGFNGEHTGGGASDLVELV